MFLELLVALAALLFAAYWRRYWRYTQYWSQLGVKVPTYPSLHPMGNHVDKCRETVFGLEGTVSLAQKQYKEMAGEKIYGCYNVAGKPVLVLRDPELVKHVMAKDFQHFVDKFNPNALKLFTTDHMADQLWRKTMPLLSGDDWKQIRSTFSPIFTSGKMKGMAHLINNVAQSLVDSGEKTTGEINLSNMFGKFSMDVIASCAFGVDARSFSEEETKFVNNARNIQRRGFSDGVKLFALMLPGGRNLLNLLERSIFKGPETMFFYEVIKSTVQHRLSSKERRNDMVDLMIDAMKDELAVEKGDDDAADDDLKTLNNKKKEFDLTTLAATALIMMVAGYDTTGGTLTFAGYNLATNPDIQDKLRDEVDEKIEANGGNQQLPYNVINDEMEYLDMFIAESLRRYPITGILSRQCTRDYPLPGFPNITVKKGQDVSINVVGMHMDPKYYPNPEQVIPERFSKEGKANMNPYAYQGFGQGPRKCIGTRFALYETKVALVALVSNFRIVATPNTPKKIEFNPKATLASPKDPILVKLERR